MRRAKGLAKTRPFSCTVAGTVAVVAAGAGAGSVLGSGGTAGVSRGAPPAGGGLAANFSSSKNISRIFTERPIIPPKRSCADSATSIEARLSRLQHTSGELEGAITGKTDSELSRRPDVDSWAAKEIICHLRDVEELEELLEATYLRDDEAVSFDARVLRQQHEARGAQAIDDIHHVVHG